MLATLSSISFQGGFILDGAPEDNFLLFTPEGETDWAEGWAYEWIHCPSGKSEEGAIFRTKDARGLEMIWRILVFEPSVRSVYYVVTAGSHTTEVRVGLKREGAGTRVNVEYIYVPFSEEGRKFVEQINEQT